MTKGKIGFILLIASPVIMLLWYMMIMFIPLNIISYPGFLFGLRYLSTLITIVGMIFILIEHRTNTFLVVTTIMTIASIPINVMITVIQWMPINGMSSERELAILSSIGFLPIMFLIYLFSFYKRLSDVGKIFTIVYVVVSSVYSWLPHYFSLFLSSEETIGFLINVLPFLNILVSAMFIVVMALNLDQEFKQNTEDTQFLS